MNYLSPLQRRRGYCARADVVDAYGEPRGRCELHRAAPVKEATDEEGAP
jgi:hypothetical protein